MSTGHARAHRLCWRILPEADSTGACEPNPMVDRVLIVRIRRGLPSGVASALIEPRRQGGETHAQTSSMNAVRIHTTGSPNVLVFEDAPRPEPAADEILIRVHAAGVNPVDWKRRVGVVPMHRSRFPVILGHDVSGVVTMCGSDVRGCVPGDAVFGMLMRHGGSYAEFALAAPGEYCLKPTTLSHVQAAAVPLAALTAWQGLFEHGNLQEGQTVLIHGAGGGVGHVSVQLARRAGARVVATAASEDLDLVSALGADIVVDFSAIEFPEVVGEVDLVFDLVAGEARERSWSLLREGGILVSALGDPRPGRAAASRATGKGFSVRPDVDQLRRITELIDQSQLSVVVTRVLPLAEARIAHERLESQHSQGKTVLSVVADGP